MQFPAFYFGETFVAFAGGIMRGLSPGDQKMLRELIEHSPHPVQISASRYTASHWRRHIQDALRNAGIKWHVRTWDHAGRKYALEPDGYVCESYYLRRTVRRKRELTLEERALRLFGPTVRDAERLEHENETLYPRRNGSLVGLKTPDQSHYVERRPAIADGVGELRQAVDIAVVAGE